MHPLQLLRRAIRELVCSHLPANFSLLILLVVLLNPREIRLEKFLAPSILLGGKLAVMFNLEEFRLCIAV